MKKYYNELKNMSSAVIKQFDLLSNTLENVDKTGMGSR